MSSVYVHNAQHFILVDALFFFMTFQEAPTVDMTVSVIRHDYVFHRPYFIHNDAHIIGNHDVPVPFCRSEPPRARHSAFLTFGHSHHNHTGSIIA